MALWRNAAGKILRAISGAIFRCGDCPCCEPCTGDGTYTCLGRTITVVDCAAFEQVTVGFCTNTFLSLQMACDGTWSLGFSSDTGEFASYGTGGTPGGSPAGTYSFVTGSSGCPWPGTVTVA